MEDIKEIANTMTRSEFLNKCSFDGYKEVYCYDELGIKTIQMLKNSCYSKRNCKICIKQAVKDIKFKDDLENETFEAECIEPVVNSIKLKNINLTSLTLVDELEKAEEEETEFKQALITFLKDRHGISREHLLEEVCDTIQVKLSVMKTIDIDVEEIVEYWNNIHLEKIKSRPRKKELPIG